MSHRKDSTSADVQALKAQFQGMQGIVQEIPTFMEKVLAQMRKDREDNQAANQASQELLKQEIASVYTNPSDSITFKYMHHFNRRMCMFIS